MNAITLPSTIRWVTDDIGAFVVEGDRKYAARWAVRCEWCEANEHATERVAPEAWMQYDGRVVYVTWRPKGHKGFDAARATIEVVPVVGQSDLGPPTPYVVGLRHNTWLITHTELPYVLPGLQPRPGRDFGVVVRKVAA